MTKTSLLVTVPCLLLSNCYDSDKIYTARTQADILLSQPASIYADSATLQTVSIALPGLRAQNDLVVDVTTDWGQWPNKSQAISLIAKYSTVTDEFQATTYLLPGRTVQPFTIKASANSESSARSFISIYRYPTLIQVAADSLTLLRKPGHSTLAKIYFTSTIGFPSYGLRFVPEANQNSSLLPSQLDFVPNKPAITRVTLLTSTTATDSLIVSGHLVNTAATPIVKPARIFLRH